MKNVAVKAFFGFALLLTALNLTFMEPAHAVTPPWCWRQIPPNTPCTTSDGQAGTLSGCVWSYDLSLSQCYPTTCKKTPPAPQCLPNG